MKRVSISHIVLLSILLPLTSLGQQEDLRLPIDVSADSTELDGLNSMVVLKGLRLSQGRIQVNADEGRATRLDFEDSVWQFSGNVMIELEDSRIECDSAEVHFFDHELTKANVLGSPATFELKRPGTDEITYAEGGQLDYDMTTEIVTFTDNVKITEGGNQISSSHLVYNIREQRFNAASSENGDDRVRIIFTPPEVTDDLRDQAEEAVEEAAEDVAEDIGP